MNDFGKQGKPPTHQELLDYLAARFAAENYSIKKMHRLIVLSQTYRMSSDDHAANLKADPNNDYLWRYSRQRLDAVSFAARRRSGDRWRLAVHT